MRVLLGSFFLLSTLVGFSQTAQRSTVGMGGATTTFQQGDQTYYVSSSIGQQSVIGTYKSEGHIVRQGFQQAPITVLAAASNEATIDATVFPNPVASMVTIAFNETLTTLVEGIVYDALGKEVLRFIRESSPTIALDLTQLSSGTYSLVVVANQRNFTTRLLKN